MRWFRTLGSRLLASHLTVVAATAVTIVIAAGLVAPTVYRAHIASMSPRFEPMTSVMEAELEAGFREAFIQALAVSVSIGVLVAVTASVVGSRRLIRPIDAVRRATRRLADGHYTERVQAPTEEELAALAADVNHLAAALEDTENRRLRLLSDVSHELRTPLTTIEGYMEAVLDSVLEPTPDIIASVAHEAGRLKRLAADIGLLSRAEEASLPLEPAPTDLVDLVSGVTTRLRPQFEEAKVELSLLAESPVPVIVDPDRITQVITNIVGNALSYTPSGGSVEVTVRRSADTAQLFVTDTGRGIASEELERIFERFYRSDRASPGGMGVGLSIARSITRLHGGEISAESAGPDRGSTFTLTLPAA